MKLKILLILLIGLITTYSCGSDDSSPNDTTDDVTDDIAGGDDIASDDGDDPVVGGVIDDRYYFANMFIPFNTLVNGERDKLIYLTRNSNGNSILREGGYRPLPSATGFDWEYMNDVFDEVTYPSTEIIVSRGTTGTYTLDDFNRTYSLDSDGKILSKEVETSNPTTSIVTTYEYNPDGDLLKFYENAAEWESFLYYNSSKNLDSIVTQFYNSDGSNDDRIVEEFLDYDNFTNPTRDLFMFEEIFLRSLNENNFRRYRRVRYLENGSQSGTPVDIDWEFVFDNEGRIIWDEF